MSKCYIRKMDNYQGKLKLLVNWHKIGILICLKFFFFKMGQSRPLFVYFRCFHIPIQMTNIQFEQFKLKKSIDGVLGTRTRGGMMEGADESTEL